jgi:MtrB/PioB family decaheme-associated outer membrane protein
MSGERIRRIAAVSCASLACAVAGAEEPAFRLRPLDLALAANPARSPFAYAGQIQTDAMLAPKTRFGSISLGANLIDLDSDSATFRQHRDMPEGFEVVALRSSSRGNVHFDFLSENSGRRDARYYLRVEPGPLNLVAAFTRVPHRYGNDGLWILSAGANGSLVAPPNVQATNQAALERQFSVSPQGVNPSFLAALANGSLQAAGRVDVVTQRQGGRLDVDFSRDKPWQLRVGYAVETRSGERPAGASFGFQNALEIAEPNDYRSDTFTAAGEWRRSWGLLRGSFRYNQFSNDVPSLDFANPFRSTDTDALNGFYGPSPFGVDGPSRGRLGLPPDSKAARGSLGFLVKLPGRTRFQADAALGQWTQDQPFIPFSSNAAIVQPLRASDPSLLPARSLDGEMRTFTHAMSFVSKPLAGLVFAARYRYYKLSNDTPRITVPGEVYFDATWVPLARISVPYAYTKDRLLVSAGYDFSFGNLEAGFAHEGWDRAFRETRRTTEGLFHVKADLHPTDWAILRVSAQRGSRDYDAYLPRRGESSSYPAGKPPTLLSELRRYDQAKRDSDRYGADTILTWGAASATVGYNRGSQDYYATVFGLQDASSELVSAEIDYAVGEKVSVFAFASRENIKTLDRGAQRGRSGAPDAASVWSSAIRDRVDTLGGGLTYGAIADKLDLRLHAAYQKADGNNDLEAAAGAVDIPGFDDTESLSLNAEAAYRVRAHWTLGVGAYLDDFSMIDSTRTGLQGYMPGGFFLVANNGDYTAKAVYLRVTYAW